MNLFAKHSHNAKTIKQCDRNSKEAETVLTSVTARSTQPGHPFVGRRNDDQPNGGRLAAGKTRGQGMARVWVAGKTV